jgi:hypothetical protein
MTTTTTNVDLVAARVLERAATLARRLVERGKPLTVAQSLAARSDIAERLTAEEPPDLEAIVAELAGGDVTTRDSKADGGAAFYDSIREKVRKRTTTMKASSAAERLGLRGGR